MKRSDTSPTEKTELEKVPAHNEEEPLIGLYAGMQRAACSAFGSPNLLVTAEER